MWSRGAVATAVVTALAAITPVTAGTGSVGNDRLGAIVVDDLVGPTQVVRHGDDLIVAQLNGGENDAAGQILRVSLADPAERTVLFDGLDKPTGVAVLDDQIWVMEARALRRGPLDGGELDTVLDGLASNGRSEGSLTVSPDGALLFETTGALGMSSGDGPTEPAEGSATLWSLDPATEEPTAVATGFKNAYARTFGPDGTLWQTEIGDGSYDGAPAPDELDVVGAGDDFGWPQCVGDRRAVAEFGGTDERCARTPRPVALFEPGATPTSVAVAPWDPDVILVSLWNVGRIVAVDTSAGRTVDQAVVTDVVTSIEHPQTLLADGDGVLVVDFDAGRVVELLGP